MDSLFRAIFYILSWLRERTCRKHLEPDEHLAAAGWNSPRLHGASFGRRQRCRSPRGRKQESWLVTINMRASFPTRQVPRLFRKSPRYR